MPSGDSYRHIIKTIVFSLFFLTSMVLSFVIDLKLERFLFLVSCFAWVIAVLELVFAFMHPPRTQSRRKAQVYRWACLLAVILLTLGLLIPYRGMFH